MFSTLFGSREKGIPIRVANESDLAATEDLAYPTDFANMLARAEECRRDAAMVLNCPDTATPSTDVLPEM